MAQRMIDNFCVIVLSKDARTVASIEPALDRSGEAPVILLLSLRIPRFAMKSQPCGAFLLPACPQTSRDGISQSKSDEVCRAFLLPMRQEILREPNLLVRVEEPQGAHCEVQGVTASKPTSTSTAGKPSFLEELKRVRTLQEDCRRQSPGRCISLDR